MRKFKFCVSPLVEQYPVGGKHVIPIAKTWNNANVEYIENWAKP